MRPLAICVAVAVLAGAARAAAAPPSVTLNGVSIDGVTSQQFENCTVVIDENGAIHIQAKGYAVRSAGDERRPASLEGGRTSYSRPTGAAVVTRRYFIATEQGPAGSQFDVGIFVNAQWIRELKANEGQAVMEITKYLRRGSNKITLVATKRPGGDRVAASDVALRVVAGEGNAGGDHVMIDTPLFEAARTAAELEDRTEEFVIEAR